MIKKEQIEQFQVMLSNAENVIIAYGEEATVDELAAAVGLAEGMALLGKQIRLASPVASDNSDISGLEYTVTELGHQNLVVSFDYTEDAVANVSYHISEDNKKFFLTVKPKKGSEPLDTSSVKFEYTGTHADMILVVGVENYEELKQIYFGYEDVYRDAAVVPFTTYPSYQSRFSFASMGRSSLSEVVGDLLSQLNVSLTENLATNLLRGIEWSTDQLQSENAGADTFEVVSHLLRSGAKRKIPAPIDQKSTSVQTSENSETSILQQTGVPKGNTDSLREALQKASIKKQTDVQVEQNINTDGIHQPSKSSHQPNSNNNFRKIRSNRNRKRRHKQQNPGGLNFQPSGHSVSGA